MTRQFLSAIANPFGVCFLVAIVIQALGLVLYLTLHDTAYAIHAELFRLSPEAFDEAVYEILAMMKGLSLILFFVPWAALKIAAPWYPDQHG
ncbi:DUF6868 family protein [Botrimarina hoheduenensis]|uniref:DUF6868 domain-containing protein n=1 Tax=Botrimarina hoheduenensis TaxID=2528000 RepID=A0A5C5VX79_9BACT|nr:hypothetical protein [Botrimarina hoheduenensis]TWT42727.1 hypothetical protein Pla111_27000 [Botrimarina hoheduenensis]